MTKIWQKGSNTPIFRYDLYKLNDIPPIQILKDGNLGLKPENIRGILLLIHEKGCLEFKISSVPMEEWEQPENPPIMEIRTFGANGQVENKCGCKTLTEMHFIPRPT